MKKIHISEKKMKENFNESLEPMSHLEKIVKKSKLNEDNDLDIKKLLSMEDDELDDDNDEFLVDDGTTPDDEAYAKRFIREKLVDAQEIIESLIDYLTYSNYAVQKGGDVFKAHLAKATNIFNELRNFFEE